MKKRRPFGFRLFGSVSLMLLLVCLMVVDALKLQELDAYIAAASSVATHESSRRSPVEPIKKWKWSLAARNYYSS